MSRLTALIVKELRQHLGAFVLLALFLVGTWCFLSLGAIISPATVTWMEVHAEFARLFVPVAGLALGNRLVVAEYHGRTQLFVEALPLRRAEMFAVKYGLGGLVLAIVCAGSVLATAALASLREPMDALFVSLVGVRTLVFAFFLWSWFFAMGFLGRLRATAYVVQIVALFVVAAASDLELVHFGPIALVGPELPLERVEWPTSALVVTAALGAFFLALAAVLGLTREGSITERLARRMSQGEKVTAGVLAIAGLIAAAELDPPNQRPPFSFPAEGVLRRDDAALEIFYVSEERRPDAEALAARAAPALVALAADLGWESAPMVRVAHRESLDGEVFEPVEVGDDDGVLVRANLRAAADDLDPLIAEVLARAIDDHSDGRASFEPLAWARDGIAGHRAWGRPLPDRVTARAIAALRGRTITAELLTRWDVLVEGAGDEAARAIATVAARQIAELRGEAALLALGRALFEEVPSRTIGPTIAYARRPIERALADEAGIDASELARALEGWRERETARLAPLLVEVPEGRAILGVEPSAVGHDLVVRVTLAHAPPEGAVLSVGHVAVGPFDAPITRWDEARTEVAWPGGTSAELRVVGRYASGDRVRVVADVSSDALGVPVRLGAARLEVP